MRKKRNDIGKERNKKGNDYNLFETYGIGYTSNTNREFYFDFDDYIKIKNYTWLEKNGYIETSIKKKTIKMHKLITNTDKQQQVDHINRKRYDNRKENLRIVSFSENSMNRTISEKNKSGFIGISFDKTYKKWRANMHSKKFNGNRYFENKEDAIKQRLEWELEYYGKDFAPQLNLFKEYGIK